MMDREVLGLLCGLRSSNTRSEDEPDQIYMANVRLACMYIRHGTHSPVALTEERAGGHHPSYISTALSYDVYFQEYSFWWEDFARNNTPFYKIIILENHNRP